MVYKKVRNGGEATEMIIFIRHNYLELETYILKPPQWPQ